MAKLCVFIFCVFLLLVACDVAAKTIQFQDGYGRFDYWQSRNDVGDSGKRVCFSYMISPYIEWSDSCVATKLGYNNDCKSIGCINYQCPDHKYKWCVRNWIPKDGKGTCTVKFSSTTSSGSSSDYSSYTFRDTTSGSCVYVCYNSYK